MFFLTGDVNFYIIKHKEYCVAVGYSVSDALTSCAQGVREEGVVEIYKVPFEICEQVAETCENVKQKREEWREKSKEVSRIGFSGSCDEVKKQTSIQCYPKECTDENFLLWWFRGCLYGMGQAYYECAEYLEKLIQK